MAAEAAAAPARPTEQRRMAWALSFGVGLLSLSQEILWVRVVALSQSGRPQAFAQVLAVFLLGIALGALLGRRACARPGPLWPAAGVLLLRAAAFDLAALWLCGQPFIGALAPSAYLPVALCLAGGGALLKGMLFPVVHHLGSTPSAAGVGRSVSRVYLANVAGSTLGPLLVGFWLLDHAPLERAFALVALGTALLGGLALLRSGRVATAAPLRLAAVLLPLLAVVGVAWPPAVVLQIVGGGTPERVRHLVQNKHGVLHVLAEDTPGSGDITFGGNAYDGRIGVDMAVNANGLDRVYLLAAVHPRPRRVLVIGLSTGAWVTAVLGMPGVEQVDVVEINPGYLSLIARYPAVAPLLDDKRLRIHIDDGRRWLRARRGERYDLVVQNTTFHWRAYTSLLLSAEHLALLRAHLNPSGIVALNTTGSLDAYRTAARVFPHAARYRSFVYMSDVPLVHRTDALAVLRACRVPGGLGGAAAAAFADTALAPGGLAWRLATEPLQSAQAHLRASPGGAEAGVITDLNLLPEYRHGDGGGLLDLLGGLGLAAGR